MEYLQSKMDELLLKDLEPTEKDKATENVQGKESQAETGEGQDENDSSVSKEATEKT